MQTHNKATNKNKNKNLVFIRKSETEKQSTTLPFIRFENISLKLRKSGIFWTHRYSQILVKYSLKIRKEKKEIHFRPSDLPRLIRLTRQINYYNNGLPMKKRKIRTSFPLTKKQKEKFYDYIKTSVLGIFTPQGNSDQGFTKK